MKLLVPGGSAGFALVSYVIVISILYHHHSLMGLQVLQLFVVTGLDNLDFHRRLLGFPLDLPQRTLDFADHFFLVKDLDTLIGHLVLAVVYL